LEISESQRGFAEFDDLEMKKDLNLVPNAEMIADHKLDADDVKPISSSKLTSMDMYERLEYRFPFYLMDVNGYIMHIKEAMKLYEPQKMLFNIHNVDLDSLQKAFKNFKSWGELNDQESEFVKFLNEVCGSEQEKLFSVMKLRNIGVLWCNGSPPEKAHEFYENV
jgi:hypothetical protein